MIAIFVSILFFFFFNVHSSIHQGFFISFHYFFRKYHGIFQIALRKLFIICIHWYSSYWSWHLIFSLSFFLDILTIFVFYFFRFLLVFLNFFSLFASNSELWELWRHKRINEIFLLNHGCQTCSIYYSSLLKHFFIFPSMFSPRPLNLFSFSVQYTFYDLSHPF